VKVSRSGAGSRQIQEARIGTERKRMILQAEMLQIHGGTVQFTLTINGFRWKPRLSRATSRKCGVSSASALANRNCKGKGQAPKADKVAFVRWV
jgi:hypothetical protein